MKRIEVGQSGRAGAGSAGTVTIGTVRTDAGLLLEVVVYAALLRQMPWYRGGTGVALLVLPYGGGQLDIARAGTEAPYRLRARMDNPLDKLPPVQLRLPALLGMAAEERLAEPVAYELFPTTLILTLPAWARRQPQGRALQDAGARA